MSMPTGPRPHSYVVADLVKQNSWRAGAEIGVFRGQTLFYLLDSFPRLLMTGVDLWVNPTDGRYERFDMPAIGQAVRRRAEVYGRRCRLHHMDSVEAAALTADGSLDFVFIDAEHSFDACSKDIIAWRPKIRPGGLLTGHDWHWKGVARALDGLAPGWTKHDKHVWSADA